MIWYRKPDRDLAVPAERAWAPVRAQSFPCFRLRRMVRARRPVSVLQVEAGRGACLSAWSWSARRELELLATWAWQREPEHLVPSAQEPEP